MMRNMKKLAVWTAASLILCTGCSTDTSKVDNLISEQASPQEVLDAYEEAVDIEIDAADEFEELPTDYQPATIADIADIPDSSHDDYDVDLTVLSSTMIYSQVYDMVYNTGNYMGKLVKASGNFSYYKDEDTGKEYFAVIISDATACCAQGIEFVLNGEHIYPEDYPALGTEITISGYFNAYEEDYTTYVQLTDAEIVSA